MRILFLDDDVLRHNAFQEASAGHDVTLVWTAAQAEREFASGKFHLACLDHDLGGEHWVDPEQVNTGTHVARWLKANPERCPRQVIVHSYNAPAARGMVKTIIEAGAMCAHMPFGPGMLALVRK